MLHRENPPITLQDRFHRIRERISRAAERSGRSGDDVTLVGAVKTLSAETIQDALEVGLRCIGDNKVQEAQNRADFLGQFKNRFHFEHHFIGHLQSNKARKAIEIFDVIQTVDSPKLANVLNRVAGEMGKKQRCLIEVKISSEDSKSGMPFSDVENFIDSFKTYPNLILQGLMTIGALNVTPDETRQLFRNCFELFKRNKSKFYESPILSMGMTDDFELAIEEGSTMVRIGRALFGERV
jgi:pyridoxal phosphate enzyme (YggS family)